MIKEDLIRKVAQLESVNDQLATEIAYVDELLVAVGFPQGLESLKAVAHEVLEYEDEELL